MKVSNEGSSECYYFTSQERNTELYNSGVEKAPHSYRLALFREESLSHHTILRKRRWLSIMYLMSLTAEDAQARQQKNLVQAL